MATRIAALSQNAAADAIAARANTGTIEVRTGTQPTTPDDSATGTLLATFTLAASAYGAASAGVAALASTPRNTTGVAAGTAGWFRILSSGAAAVMDGAVGTSGQQLNLNTTTISVGVAVSITSGSITMPVG